MCRDSRVQLDALETNIFLQEKGTETWHAVSKAYVVFFRLCSTRCTTGNFHNTKFGHGSWPQITFSGRFGQWCVKEHLTVSRSIWQSHRNMMLQSYFQEKKGVSMPCHVVMLSGKGSGKIVRKGFLKYCRQERVMTCCQEEVRDMPSGRGSWHVVRKRFVTYCQEGVPDMLWSRKGSWHVARKGFIPYRQERVLNMSSGRVSKHVVRKGFLTYMYILYFYIHIYIYLFTYLYLYLYIYMYIVRSTFRPFHQKGFLTGTRHFVRKGFLTRPSERVQNMPSGGGPTCCAEGVPDTSSGRGSWRAVWKMFLTRRQEGVMTCR